MARQVLCVRTMSLVLMTLLIVLALLGGLGSSKAVIVSVPDSDLLYLSGEPRNRSLRQNPTQQTTPTESEGLTLNHAKHDAHQAFLPQGTSGPNPAFSASDYNPCINQSVQFNTSNTSGTTYAWNFGDGSPSLSGAGLFSVTHTYVSTGAYNATLTTTSPASSSQQIFVTNCAPISSSQGNWFFGFFGELHFNTGVALPGNAALTHNTIYASEASVAQSDASGNLLFYSDGRMIWNNLHALVNGGLNGGEHPVQALSVPDPADLNPSNPSSFYLISMPGYISPPFPPNANGHFGYTKVSVSGSNLALSFVNTPIAPPAGADNRIAEMVTAVPGCGTNYWIIVHGSYLDDDPDFRHALFVYPLTSAGIGTPVVYPIVGPALFGQLKASPDGTKIAHGTGDIRSAKQGNSGYSQVLDFNRNTGVLSNPRVINRYAYGVSFSSNSQLLYLTESVSGLEKIFQYDLSTTDINVGKKLVADVPATYSALQLGPDNKIYVALNGNNNHLAVINYPDEPNTTLNPNACGYSFNGPFLNIPSSGTSVMSGFGLPNMIDVRKTLSTPVDCCPAITLSPAVSALPGAIANTPYGQTLGAMGGTEPYTFTVSSGSLPPGMVLAGGGLLHGTPVTPGAYNFTVKAVDANGCVGLRVYQVNVSCAVITLNPAAGALPRTVVNTPYSQTFAATGGCGLSFTYSVTSGLPPGLTLGTTGVLSGTATDSGDFIFTVTVTDSCGCSQSQVYTLRVQGPLMISRFRANGPAGTGDEFVEIFNAGDSPVLVSTFSNDSEPGGSANGIGVFASAGNGFHPVFEQAANVAFLICRIPGNTVIKARGYFLCAGKDYSLGTLGNNGGKSHSAPDSTAIAGALDLPDDAGLALLDVALPHVFQCVTGSINCPNGFNYGSLVRNENAVIYDRVGFGPYGPGSPINIGPGAYPGNIYPSLASQYCEGTCLQPIGDASTIGPGSVCPTTVGPAGTAFPVSPSGTVGSPAIAVCYGESGQYEFVRRQTVFDPNRGTLHRDTDNNADDFILVSPNPGNEVGSAITGISGVSSVLGAAGPQNSAAPPDTSIANLTRAPFDVGSQLSPPNAERNYGLDPGIANPANNPEGTFSLRFRYSNNSGRTLLGLRFKVDNVSTLCGHQAATMTVGTGDARNLSSSTDCGTGSFTAILKLLNSPSEVVVDNQGIARFVNGMVIEDLSVALPSPGIGPLSPLGGGVDNSIIVGHADNGGGFVGDGVMGGIGNFGTTMATTGPTNVLRVRVTFGVVKAGRFILLLTPMAKFSPTP